MIRSFLAILAVAFGLGVSKTAMADSATTRPAVKIAVVPFDVVGDAGHEWIGRAMQEGLATGLQKSSGMDAVIVAAVGPMDINAALSAGKSVNADLVIFGSIQILDDQIRVGGQIISIGTGKSVGVLKCDGSPHDLFSIEDLLSERTVRLVMPAPVVSHSGSSAVVHQANLELVGPTIADNSPRYFDGSLTSITTPPVRFRDEYDRYYYQSGSTSGCGFGCGAGCGIGYGFPAGPILLPSAAKLGTW